VGTVQIRLCRSLTYTYLFVVVFPLSFSSVALCVVVFNQYFFVIVVEKPTHLTFKKAQTRDRFKLSDPEVSVPIGVATSLRPK
jgi:hypothetical protein